MSEKNEAPERRRERLKQEEIKRNPAGNVNDAFNRNEAGNLSGLAGSLGWKGLGILITAMIIGFIVASLFLK
ncbi:phage capsid protein [Bacillus sp. Root239]|nr:phage capsid protein [Bacillus sp. Root239]